jgi:hypothetical protein
MRLLLCIWFLNFFNITEPSNIIFRLLKIIDDYSKDMRICCIALYSVV